jgi:hypothetical protein
MFYYISVVLKVALLPLLLVIQGCGGELSYKRGAGPTDFQNEKQACTLQYDKQEQIDACLANEGWIVVSPDKPLFMEASVTTSRSPTETSTELEKKDADNTSKTLMPLDVVEVGSWWKVGASPAQLMDDGDACLNLLGDEHYIKNNMTQVTVGVVLCMKQKGWFVLQK